MKKYKKYKFIYLFLYFIFNLSLLLVIFRGGVVINGDGPGGFGEIIIKGIILQTSIILFFVGLLSSVSIFRTEIINLKPNMTISIVATFILILFCWIMVADACSNKYGYCRNWIIFIQ